MTTAARNTLFEELESLYADEGDPDFGAFVRGREVGDDETLADLIDLDGRLRLERRLQTDLSRYFDAVPQLSSLPVALDAAVEFTLRALSREGRDTSDAVRSLIERYPGLERPIREAAALGRNLLTTDQMAPVAEPAIAAMQLPMDYGPRLADGHGGRYELRQQLGSGSQGSVFLAADRYLSEADRPAWVAIKVLADAGASRAMRQRVVDEATKARRVTHANVVRVLDRGVDQSGREFIVYEYVDSGDLASAVKTGRVTPEPRGVARLMAAVARGVQAAHSAGLVHCDLKPANILLGSTGVPKVGDFGIAARAGGAEPSAPSERALGNLAFIAPEQYRGEEGAATAPADIYALGGVLYHLLTGALPNGSSVAEIARTHSAAEGRTAAPSVRTVLPDVDRDLEGICRRALSPRAVDRHASANALASDLEAWLRREPIAWMNPSRVRKLVLFARRQPAVILSIAASAVLLIAATAAVVNSSMAAASAQVLAETEQGKMENMRKIVMGLTEVSRTRGKLSAEWVPLVTVMESIFGPEVLRYGRPGEPTLWKMRIEAIERIVADAKARGQGTALQTLLWKQLRAFWLLRDDQGEAARVALEELRPHWARLLGENDEFLMLHDAMIAGTEVLRAEQSVRQPKEFGRVDEKALEEAERTLLNAFAAVRRIGHNGAYYRLFAEHVARLYAPSLLDKPDDAEVYRKFAEPPPPDADDPYAPVPDSAPALAAPGDE